MHTTVTIVFLAIVGSVNVMVNAAISGTNGAGTSPSQRYQITAAQAQRVIDAAAKKAENLGQPMNLAVVDFSGYLVAFLRMDNGWPGSVDISIKKARTCSLFYGFTSAGLYNNSQPGGALYGIQETNGGLVVFGGGLPIYRQGKMIGAFGVSGGSVEEDVEVATAGVNVFNN